MRKHGARVLTSLWKNFFPLLLTFQRCISCLNYWSLVEEAELNADWMPSLVEVLISFFVQENQKLRSLILTCFKQLNNELCAKSVSVIADAINPEKGTFAVPAFKSTTFRTILKPCTLINHFILTNYKTFITLK